MLVWKFEIEKGILGRVKNIGKFGDNGEMILWEKVQIYRVVEAYSSGGNC